MDRRFLLFLSAAAILVPAILLSDGPGLSRQILLGATTGGFLWTFARGSSVGSRPILCAIVVATLGEVILSLGWKLYGYQFATLPFYVPVGHGLFYALAVESARQEKLRRHATIITATVIVVGSTLAARSFALFNDQLGLIWWTAAVLLILRSRSRLLLSLCLVYTTLLELLGTAIGNWRWAAEVPALGIHASNPPGGVGILYILLDLITVSVCMQIAAKRSLPDVWWVKQEGESLVPG